MTLSCASQTIKMLLMPILGKKVTPQPYLSSVFFMWYYASHVAAGHVVRCLR